MAEIVVMPKMGLTATEATLVAWHRDIGDYVEEGDIVCDVETDKITNELESPAAGTLLRRIDIDQVVPIGEPIAVIGAPDEDVAEVALYDASRLVSRGDKVSSPPEETPTSEDSVQVVAGDQHGSDSRMKASPAARRRAEELDVRLDALQGSGPEGRITTGDVEEAAAGDFEHRRVELTPLRRAVAKNMTLSASVPQFTLERDVEVGPLLTRLSQHKGAQDEVPTVVDVLGAIIGRRLRDHERFLCSWRDDHLMCHDQVDIGMAVALDEGLIVPVIRAADTLSAYQIARQRRQLQQRAQRGALTNDDVGRAVFTITNLGPFGVDRFIALVDPPQSGIIAVGRIRENGSGSTLSLTLSADHRVVDGADGARLLADLAIDLTDDDVVTHLLTEDLE